ncbi:BamA/TamA family outer membrane protein [Parabacteroides sp. OttesenSCG-928-G21]|nr:BamA/TamA family outer membrane protein [Parabacteroides sp. OttesenSCG-928-G21]
MKGVCRIGYIFFFVLLLAACSTTKFVEEGDYLLDKVKIDSDNTNYRDSELRSYVRQLPNFKTFGLTKWQLYVYNWSGKNENNWFNKQLRRMGEAPVILDADLVEQSTVQLERFLTNKGYVNADVVASIDTSRYKKATVTYHVTSNEPYRIRDYEIGLTDPVIDSIAHLTAPYRNPLTSTFRLSTNEYTPLIKEGVLFDRDVLDAERQRITSLLRYQGYYAFNREHLSYLADSSFNQNIVDVKMQLRPFLMVKPNGTAVDTVHQQYYIKDVTVLTDYNTIDLQGTGQFITTDSVKNGDITVLYGRNGRTIRPGVLRKSTYLSPGQLYSEKSVEQTYSAFSSLRALKNINIRFSEFQENDTMKLNAYILTTSAEPQSIGFDVEGTNSAGDLGFASSISYQHRNLFKGSEVFSARIRGAYESLSGNKGSGLTNYWELGGEASVTFPRFLFPFISYDFKRRLRASTELSLSYNQQRRPEYERAIVSGGLSYIWNDRNNTQARHTFKLLDINYVFLPRIDSLFKSGLPESIVLYNYSNQFIMGSGYTYSFTNYDPLNRRRNTHSIRFSIEFAGNILNALSHITNSKKNTDGVYEVFGINYAQYAKADIDLSKAIVIDDKNSIALHLGVGVAVPYGNAKRVPFERQYFSGGANSVRGWSVRRLGPGSMTLSDETTFALQAGDVRLDANVEYRSKLFWKFELAAYVDAGNIWLVRPNSDQVDGNFDFSRFYKEIAFSYGLGLRLDFDYFLLRFDTGFKAYNPQETGSRKWAIAKPNFSDNFAWHFAVGYPF